MGLGDDIREILRDHLKKQPYQICCAECGAELDLHSMILDADENMMIEVCLCKCGKE